MQQQMFETIQTDEILIDRFPSITLQRVLR
jgi:hypothetical protein